MNGVSGEVRQRLPAAITTRSHSFDVIARGKGKQATHSWESWSQLRVSLRMYNQLPLARSTCGVDAPFFVMSGSYTSAMSHIVLSVSTISRYMTWGSPVSAEGLGTGGGTNQILEGTRVPARALARYERRKMAYVLLACLEVSDNLGERGIRVDSVAWQVGVAYLHKHHLRVEVRNVRRQILELTHPV